MDRKIQDWVAPEDRIPEEWKPIIGYENFYMVSNHGRVKSILKRSRDGKSKPENRIMNLSIVGQGYLSVNLYSYTVPNRRLVHILVGRHFIDNPENKRTINHLFGEKTDNYFEHLAWATYKENINHAFDMGLNKKMQLNDKRISKPVVSMNEYKDVVNDYPSISEAARILKLAASNISVAIKKGNRSGGYFWAYSNTKQAI